MWFIILRFTNKGFELVIDTAGLARVSRGGLKSYGSGAVRGQLKVKRVRVGAQFFDQPLLRGGNKSQFKHHVGLNFST